APRGPGGAAVMTGLLVRFAQAQALESGVLRRRVRKVAIAGDDERKRFRRERVQELCECQPAVGNVWGADRRLEVDVVKRHDSPIREFQLDALLRPAASAGGDAVGNVMN